MSCIFIKVCSPRCLGASLSMLGAWTLHRHEPSVGHSLLDPRRGGPSLGEPDWSPSLYLVLLEEVAPACLLRDGSHQSHLPWVLKGCGGLAVCTWSPVPGAPIFCQDGCSFSSWEQDGAVALATLPWGCGTWLRCLPSGWLLNRPWGAPGVAGRWVSVQRGFLQHHWHSETSAGPEEHPWVAAWFEHPQFLCARCSLCLC